MLTFFFINFSNVVPHNDFFLCVHVWRMYVINIYAEQTYFNLKNKYMYVTMPEYYL